MAFSHIYFNSASANGPQLRSALSSLESGYDQLLKTIGVMQTMIDGDGTQDVHYAEVRARFGFDSDAMAHAAYNESQSLAFKLKTDDTIDHMNAALLQAFNKFR